MNLLSTQRAFLSAIAADDTTPPASLGMAIYRQAYRARLSQALETGYERTRAWVGEEAFAAAAAHYVLSNPPGSWTLDLFGSDFPAVLAELFAQDPEVAELAWLEWQMQQAFAAPDREELDADRLVAARLSAEDWTGLRLIMAAGFAQRPVWHDLSAIWNAGSVPARAPHPLRLIVWRKACQPHFRLLEVDEGAALSVLSEGGSFGEAAALVPDPERLGGWFGQWLGEGLFSAFALAGQSPRATTRRKASA